MHLYGSVFFVCFFFLFGVTVVFACSVSMHTLSPSRNALLELFECSSFLLQKFAELIFLGSSWLTLTYITLLLYVDVL